MGNLILVGAGHAHMETLLNARTIIDEGHRIVLVSPSAYQYYSGMGPGLLGGTYEPQQVRFHVRKMAESRGVAFIKDQAVGIDVQNRTLHLASGQTLTYDLISFNIGSEVPLEKLTIKDETVVPAKPVENLYHARQRLLSAIEKDHLKVAVIGGGPAGVEIAGNLWRLLRHRRHGAEISLYCSKLLPNVPERVRQAARDSLDERKIRVVEGVRAQAMKDRRLVLTDRSDIVSDIAFIAIGTRPPVLFQESGIGTGPTGGLLVNRYLQSPDHPEIFGGGDCIDFRELPLPKVGVMAVRQGPILLNNLRTVLNGKPLLPFQPPRNYLLIMNMGNGKGVAWRGGLNWSGRLAFLLKDRIDRGFMRKYQVSGEKEEPASPETDQ